MEVTINLPDRVYSNVVDLAKKTSRRVDEFIADKIQESYSVEYIENEQLLSDWSNDDVLALANLKLPPTQDKRLSQLLEKQRESNITMNEKVELEGLMGLYNLANSRKSEGIVEAVKRGLINSPKDLK